MAKEIKQKIVLEGEQQYRQALRDAQRNLKTLRSELKAETAELGANATAQQKNEARLKSLKQQIKEQEQIVKTYRAALEEVKEKYSDNADEIAKWEQKLNDARTSLANMHNELQKVNSGLDNTKASADMATVATKSVADALGDIANVGESVSSAIENVFKGMMSRITAMVGDMYALIVETAGKANGWVDTAEFWGTDAATIQQWEHAVKSQHGDFGTMANVMTRLALGGKDKEIAELLGLSSNGYTNMWDFGIAAMDRLEFLKGSDLNGYMTALEKIFGSKKAVDVMDLVNDWSDIKDSLGTFDAENGGYGLTGDEINYMSDVATQIDTIKEKWVALQDLFATKLATITADLMIYVNGGLDGLNEYMNADNDADRQAALAKIRENVEGFFRKVVQIIRDALNILSDVGKDLQQSDDPLTRMIGDILVNMTNALQWFIDNQEAVKGAFETIFGAWLIAKLAAVAGKLSSILLQIETIKAFKGLGGLGNAAGAGGGGAAAAGGGAAAKAAGSSWLTNLIGAGSSFAMSGGMSVLGPLMAMAGAGIAGAKMIAANLNDPELNKIYGDDNGEGNVIDTMSEASWAKAAEYYKLYKDPNATGSEAAMAAREALYAQLEAEGYEKAEQAVSLLENTFDNFMAETDPDGIVADVIARHPDFFGRVAEESVAASGLNLTPEQRAAAEAFWDIYRQKGDEFSDEEWDAYEGAFAGQEDLFDELEALIEQVVQAEDSDDWRNMENLPADWFMNSDQWNGGQLTGNDLTGFRDLPDAIAAAARTGTAAGVSGISVSLDGYTVGRLVAPYVSQQIARDLPF